MKEIKKKKKAIKMGKLLNRIKDKVGETVMFKEGLRVWK